MVTVKEIGLHHYKEQELVAELLVKNTEMQFLLLGDVLLTCRLMKCSYKELVQMNREASSTKMLCDC